MARNRTNLEAYLAIARFGIARSEKCESCTANKGFAGSFHYILRKIGEDVTINQDNLPSFASVKNEYLPVFLSKEGRRYHFFSFLN